MVRTIEREWKRNKFGYEKVDLLLKTLESMFTETPRASCYLGVPYGVSIQLNKS